MINRRVLLPLGVFLACFVLIFRWQMGDSIKAATCRSNFELFEIAPQGSVVAVAGEYAIFPEGMFHLKGRTTYAGTIEFRNAAGLVTKQMPVSREMEWKLSIRDNKLHWVLVSASKRLGDHSDDALVKQLIFPISEPGEVNNSTLFLLEDKVMAAGPESVPRMLCREQ
ncbi:hypothetical protein CIG19_02480 [Enterobacterales bacterium CwR94]|nr:hypothetical protein CIG19_02480 [Enterobacterales bacterium CwR94]